MARLRCLGAVQDDLHDYAEAINARLGEYLEANPIAIADFGNFEGIVLHRIGRLQAELITLLPGATLPSHVHPFVDSVDLLVDGNVCAFRIGNHNINRFVKGVGLRIPAWAPHGGTASQAGVAFVSCQRWGTTPSHIGLNWLGAPAADAHREALATVR